MAVPVLFFEVQTWAPDLGFNPLAVGFRGLLMLPCRVDSRHVLLTAPWLLREGRQGAS